MDIYTIKLRERSIPIIRLPTEEEIRKLEKNNFFKNGYSGKYNDRKAKNTRLKRRRRRKKAK